MSRKFQVPSIRLAMPGDGELEDIDPRLSIEHLEVRQRAMLEDTWSGIEARIDALLAATGYASS